MYHYANNHKICLHGYGTKIENYVDLEFTFSKKKIMEHLEHFDRNIFSEIDFNDQAVC